MMISVLIVDDERRARNGLKILIGQHLPEIDRVYEASNAEEATEVVKEQTVDLVFLDIEMPSMSGISWMAGQMDRNFEVIFTTAYNEYAIQAIRLSALDYLLKPIAADDLRNAFDRFIARTNTHSDSKALIESLIYNLNTATLKQLKIAIPVVGGSIFFNVSDIIHCEAQNNYTIFYLINRQKYTASQTLKEYDDLLSHYDFLRVHQSHLVNPRYIKRYIKGILNLEEDHTVSVSRRKQAWITERLKRYFS